MSNQAKRRTIGVKLTPFRLNNQLRTASNKDNVPRANRVQQLAADIARIQTQIKEEIDDGRVQDEKAIRILGEIATKAGYQTLEEYETAAFKLLTPEERASIDKMKKEVTALDHDMGISHAVFRGLIVVGVLLSGASATQAAVKLITWGRVTLEVLSNTPKFLQETESTLKVAQKGGNVLIAIGVLVDAGLLIAEAINGSEQRHELREAIKKLCSHRFIAKQLQQEAHIILGFRTDAHEFLKMKSKYEDWIKAGRETKESADGDLKKMYTLFNDLKTKINKLSSQGTWDLLDKQDEDSKIAWKKEDPPLTEILKYINEHPELSKVESKK
ncbi:hypothetical protein M413DRAFT_32791 [Hebeloma cylindrosporum]|uniref:Uncharacterized protein n=1 Tax=Hebeloma cylindrosporum TaxID=76867 RepID=A0A0C2Y1X0_HEBCY|nr:hypothetical protein M413DRAFT_32791 [Hebeloma cylindrosporum h7]